MTIRKFECLVCITLLLFSLFLSSASHAQNGETVKILQQERQAVGPENVFRDSLYYTWCNSIIKGDDGRYHLFYSRWPKSLGFYAWLTHSEVAHAVSEKPDGPYKHLEVVLTGRGGTYWDAFTAHNPKIEYFDGNYYLYYIGTNYGNQPLADSTLQIVARQGMDKPIRLALRRNQRTGIAISKSINGPWKRSDVPLIEPSGPITTLTVNPGVTQGPDGRFFMIIKGDKPGGERLFIRNQAVAIASHPAGPFEIQPEPAIGNLDTEDVSIWYSKSDQKFYAVFHASGYIGFISSIDGINWERAKDDVVMLKKGVAMSDGAVLVPDRLERPFVFTENDKPSVLALAVKKDNDAFIVFVPLGLK